MQPLVEHLRERVRGIEAHRRHDWQQLGVEVAGNPLQLLGGPLASLQKANALVLEPRDHLLVENSVLLFDELVGDPAYAVELLGGTEVVRTGLNRPVLHLLEQARHPHLEELVEIGRGDAQESQPFQQRRALEAGLLQHPPIEREQAQLAIDVQLGVV